MLPQKLGFIDELNVYSFYSHNITTPWNIFLFAEMLSYDG